MKKLIFSIFVLMFTLSLISAPAPPMPHLFKGNVIYSGGVPDGYYITAKIGTAIHGQCLIINNQYGYNSEDLCIILSYNNNVLINFYIGDTLIGSHNFIGFEDTNLDFTLDYLPPRPPILSNGICEPHLGECSFNFLDCHVSLTNACAGNSRCDTEIGETCATTPGDCGACPTTPTSGGGGSGGGGSSGGGGVSGGGVSTTTTTSTSPTDSEETDNGGTGELLNGGSKTDSKTGTNWLTGAVIGAFGETGSTLFLIFIILVIAGVILFFVMRAKEEKNINAKIKEMIKKRR